MALRRTTTSTVTGLVVGLVVAAGASACAGGSTTETGATETSAASSAASPAAAPGATAPAPVTATTAPVRDRTVFAFPTAASVDGWVNQDDPVMGGVSRSAATWSDGALVFSGNLSLENNGGFASVLSPRTDPAGPRMAGATGLTLDATGDGRTYVVQLRSADRAGAYIQRVTTEAGAARSYDLPISGFEPVNFMLQRDQAAPPLDPADVGQVAIYVTDKQEGPFSLQVRRLAATGTPALP